LTQAVRRERHRSRERLVSSGSEDSEISRGATEDMDWLLAGRGYRNAGPPKEESITTRRTTKKQDRGKMKKVREKKQKEREKKTNSTKLI
jgi:hypothetical protein